MIDPASGIEIRFDRDQVFRPWYSRAWYLARYAKKFRVRKKWLSWMLRNHAG